MLVNVCVREYIYSFNGLAPLLSRKLIDIVVKSSNYQACVLWNKKTNTDEYIERYEQHEETCSGNHDGSTGKLEIDAINEMFLSPEEKFEVLHVDYIGDGDSKTF